MVTPYSNGPTNGHAPLLGGRQESGARTARHQAPTSNAVSMVCPFLRPNASPIAARDISSRKFFPFC